VHQIQYTQRF